MADFLDTMAAASAARAGALPASLAQARFDTAPVPLTLGDFDVIAEIKDRSPAEGDLVDAAIDRADRALQYAAGGAAAISVLTEPTRFAGSLEHLAEVARAVPETPVMRKDFLVAPVQLYEARAAGASGVLLIVALLDDALLKDMLSLAAELELFVLLEAFDADDLARAAQHVAAPGQAERAADGQLLIGVNTRNLRTLAVDTERLAKLAPKLPACRAVAESGLGTAADAAAAAALGYRLALVGTALMRAADPAALVGAMRAAGAARWAA